MAARQLELNIGIETSPQTPSGSPSADGDVVLLGYANTTYQKKVSASGTAGSPTAISAGTSIAHGLTITGDEALLLIQGNGGAVIMSATPQVAAPTRIGQRVTIVGCSDTNTVTLSNSSGLTLNGDITLENRQALQLIAITLTEWLQLGRNQ